MYPPQTELRLDGARLFDISTYNQLLLISRRLPRMGARDALTKVPYLDYSHRHLFSSIITSLILTIVDEFDSYPLLAFQMSLIYPNETEDIQLPPNTKAVKDLRISSLNGDLALYTSLGKRLAVLR